MPDGGGFAEDHLFDSEDVAGDLLHERDKALAHLGGGGRDRDAPVFEAAARRRVVVEPGGEHEVLEADRKAHASPDAPAVRRPAGTTRESELGHGVGAAGGHRSRQACLG